MEKTNENVNPSAEPPAPRYVTCFCLHCKGGIEFDSNYLSPNEKLVFPCPHCQKETILSLPEVKAPPVPEALATPMPKPEIALPPTAPLPPPPEVITPPPAPLPPKPETSLSKLDALPRKPEKRWPEPKKWPMRLATLPPKREAPPSQPEILPPQSPTLPPPPEPILPPIESIPPKLEPISPRLEPISPRLESISPRLESISPRLEPISPKLETFPPKPEAFPPLLETPPPTLESLPVPPKLEAMTPLPAPLLTKPEPVAVPAPPTPAQSVAWQVEIPLGGRDGYIGYYEGERAASFYWEFGGGVVQAIIHIGSPTHWSKLYPWAAERRTEILQRVIREVIRQRGLICRADIDEKSGHIFFRDLEVAKSAPAPPARPILPPQAPAQASPKPVPNDEANWQQQMGVAYFRQNDFGAAVKCFLQAAELGDVEAQCYLGFCFMYGQGVDKDEAQSLAWFLKAAGQGNVGAEYCLGGAYYLGRGVAKDFSAAVKWWRKAGEHGNADAQFSLAGCFEKGEGVMQNFVEAYKWAKRAAAQGHPAAPKKAEALLLKMNPEQIKIVRALG